MKSRHLLLAILGAACAVAAFVISHQHAAAAEAGLHDQVALSLKTAEQLRPMQIVYEEQSMPKNAALADVLQDMGLQPAQIADVVQQAQQVFDLRKVRAGNELQLGVTRGGDFRSLRYNIDREHDLWVTSGSDGIHAQLRQIHFTIETATVQGTIDDSLFNAVLEAGESPQLAVELANIFAWDIDFYTDPRKGDTFRLVVQKKIFDGNAVSYGEIYAAEYVNSGTPYRAVRFQDGKEPAGYYTPEGKSLKKAFLRSPLKFAAPISSHFSRHRFHPVLKIYRPHLGTDYAAPVGTPVQAVANGTVIFAGRKSGAGNLVHLRHSNGMESMYMHLSRILVRRGQRVEQGRTIGLVGATGLATGPHLDFRILEHGQYRNFETMKLPPSQPISKTNLAQFVSLRDRWFGIMDGQPQLAQGKPPEKPAQQSGP